MIEQTLDLKAGCVLDTMSYSITTYADDIAALVLPGTGVQLLIFNVTDLVAKKIIKFCERSS